MAIKQTPDEFMQAYERAMNARDLETARSMIDEDAIFLFSNESIHKGRPAILKAIQNNFDSIQDEVFKFANLTWFVKSDELSACIYDFTWSGKIDGKPAAGFGRGTSILKRVGMEWVIIQEHLSRGKFAD